MNGFRYKYTKYLKNSRNCQCENNVTIRTASNRYTIEDEVIDEKEASPTIFEVDKRVVYYTFKPRNEEEEEEDFNQCLEVGFQWQLSGHPCNSCWLALKKWKTSPTFESEHADLEIQSFKIGALVHFTKFNYHYAIAKGLTCKFQHDRKEVQIFLDAKKTKKLIVHYAGLHKIFLMENEDCLNFYFHLNNAPLLFKKPHFYWDQVTSFESDPELKKEIISFSNMICIALTKSKGKELLNRMRSRCHSTIDFVFCNMTNHDLTGQDYTPQVERLFNISWDHESLFESTYAFYVLLHTGYVVMDSILLEGSRNFESNLTKLHQIGERYPERFQEACYSIFKRIENGNIMPFFDALNFYCRSSRGVETRNPEGIASVRKVTITPTRTIFLPPQQHISNRVLRNYDEEYLLQVSIKQDNMDLVTFHLNGNPDGNFMEDNFELKSGIKIGNRHYKFLGCSNSQLREHGFWMYAMDTKGKTAEDIRREIGFNNIIGDVSKKLSRLGLFFSSSVNSKELPESCIIPSRNLEDVERDGYNFSDGIGKISPNLVHKLLGPRTEDRYMPSAFQMRYPGFKGMLAVSPDLRNGDEIKFRESQHKFRSTSKEKVIDILKCSGPRRVYLNRSLAMVLEQKDIPAEVMMKLQDAMIQQQIVKRLLTDSDTESMLKSSCQFLKIPYGRFQRAGFDLAVDPFLRTLITTGCQRRLSLLREKANILVPEDKGRIMFGVLDEVGVLRPDEVFIQYTLDVDSKGPSRAIPLEGPVLVTRNPCHHPGDIQRLQAVNRKELNHHLDTVVFPRTGRRPLPDMMGGGDLDGDEFVVIWSKDLLFKTNDPPMDYNFGDDNRRENSNATVDDMIDFFYKYLKFNDLGKVCNAHLVYADTQKGGIRSPKCMEAALIIPQALDFNKTGDLPQYNEKIEKYPDFMGKFYLNPTYRSNSVLGKLYRKALMYFPHGGIAVKKLEVQPNPLLEYPSYEELIETAMDDMHVYEDKLRAILTQQGLDNFEESIIGHVSKNSYASSKGDQESLITILEKSISLLIEDTKKKYEEHCFKLCREKGIVNEKGKNEIKLKLASAYYVVTYSRGPLTDLSFPWAIGPHLCQVAEANARRIPRRNPDNKSSAIKKLAQILTTKHEETNNWIDPFQFINKWALANKLWESSEDNVLFLLLIYTKFSENYEPWFTVYDALKQVIEFFEWISSDSMNFVPSNEHEKELLEKITILASICYTALPISLNPEYLGFPDPEGDLETGPLDLKDLEGLRISERDTRIDVSEFKEFLVEKSGVSEVFLTNNSSNEYHFDLVIKARGLTWQLIYLEKLIFDHYKNYCVTTSR